ncbi:hypothetical protein GUJ93_ZPchr0007g5761 [Zizania palustris]|uniref:Uncharacterized protein n=1 Tax=Zizania palustris TaxID=103762 RepID=A0A8J5TE27_ZIZPA|nr:hypothetical protein GUJ93_ZPchr0007g5761 [Zizania palustris]
MSSRAARSGMLRQKENSAADAQVGKRQRTAAGAAARAPFSAAANNAPPPAPEPSIDFVGRDDVDALLNEKMKGKNKMDYKGKSEQMQCSKRR